MNEDDAELLYQLDQDPKVMTYLTGGKTTSKTTITETALPRLKAFSNSEKGWGLWHASISDTQEFIGWVLVRPMDFFSKEPQWHNLELGWRFMQSSWGKGFASEAALHIKTALHQQLHYKTFSATAAKDNLASIAIMKKIGLTYLKSYLHSDELYTCQSVYYQQTINN